MQNRAGQLDQIEPVEYAMHKLALRHILFECELPSKTEPIHCAHALHFGQATDDPFRDLVPFR